VLGDTTDRAPDWLEDQFSRIPQIITARRTAAAEKAMVLLQQQQQDDLRRQREAWVRGLDDLRTAANRTESRCTAALGELREAAVELAHAIACKLVFQQLKTGTFPLDRLVTEVLSRLNSHEPATVRLHPEDLALLRTDEEFAQSLDSQGNVRLIADPKLARGDCTATAGEISVIYELQRQIEEIRRELLSTVTGHAEPGS
jgi:flagellar biosynthesis/type III secretory pathway protein FliH